MISNETVLEILASTNLTQRNVQIRKNGRYKDRDLQITNYGVIYFSIPIFSNGNNYSFHSKL